MNNKYVALVVLYCPTEQTVSNLRKFEKNVMKLIVVDNTPKELKGDYIGQIGEIGYISSGKNEGLAEALYRGCEKAIQDGYDYVLTLDQDTVVPTETVAALIKRAENSNNQNVAIICPEVYAFKNDGDDVSQSYPVYTCTNNEEECNWVMTSGSLMNLSLYQRAGKIDKTLFIDHIDIDIGMKFYLIGGKILRQRGAPVYQHLGHSQERQFLWKKIHPMFDSPQRTYYVARNQIYLAKKYGYTFWKFSNVSYIKMLIKILFYETNRMEKLQMFIKGIHDGLLGKMGELR